MSHQAAYDFASVHPEELSVRAGERLVPLAPPQDGWVKCRSVATGLEGFVPETYVKEAAPAVAAPRRSAPRAPAAATASVPPVPPAYGAQQQTFQLQQHQTSGSVTQRGGGEYEIDRRSIPYQENLGQWRERERRFLQGEAERLPQVQMREYYYWDRSGARQGPLTEAEMKRRFDTRQVSLDTYITPITTATASEALPKMTVTDYFPDVAQTFATAPIPPIENHTWLYLDDAGQVQGPFDAQQMREWFLDNYFNAETKAKLASRKDVGFVPLGVLFGPDGADAFLHDGDQITASVYPQTWPNASPAVPAALTASSYGSGQFNTFGSYGSTNDPFAVAAPPPALSVNPFASPLGRSASSSRLTPKAQSGRMLLSMAINGTPPPPAITGNNPFEASDYSAPSKPLEAVDDWGITWDDEKDEVTEASKEAAVPLPVSGTKDEDTRKLAPFDRIKKEYLGSHDTLYRFLTRALPKDLGTVRCKIKRSIVGTFHINYNLYELYLEKDDGSLGPQIMRAVKHKRLGIDSYFNFEIGSASPMHSGTVIGEATMTALGTQFLLHNNVKNHRGRPHDLACVHYLRTGGGGGPRKMTVAIPGFLKESESEFVEWPHGGSIKKSNLVTAIESLNFKDIQPLMNKPPVWSEKRQAWTLNFHGRVTRASVKNFQLVRPEDHDHIVLQHGRVGQDTFTMDMAWPLSPVQAFFVCISSLHAKLGVE